jgi:prepilin signal peptidase PulO-like enzyme (type II secretory pathway)
LYVWDKFYMNDSSTTGEKTLLELLNKIDRLPFAAFIALALVAVIVEKVTQ